MVPRHHATGSDARGYLASIDPSRYRTAADRQTFLYSIGMAVLHHDLSDTAAVTLGQYATSLVPVGDVPDGCTDLLGSVYQYLNTKHENLVNGSFYTGVGIAADLAGDLDFGANQTVIDPACGSGALLLATDAAPDRMYGLDNDPIAVMIAKFNYFAKFPDGPPPNIVCTNFFGWYLDNQNTQFDYLVANPPYGANITLPDGLDTKIVSGETFSHFIEIGMRIVKPGGYARFLVPDSLLNIKRHSDVRRILLDDFDLRRVKRYGQHFSGVMTDVHQLEVAHGKTGSVRMEQDTVSEVPKAFIESFPNRVMAYLTDDDIRLIEHARTTCTRTLADCQFGMGIITGGNTGRLHSEPGDGLEPIISGKEVSPYVLGEPRWHIRYDRDTLQQVAPDSIYRAPVKLVYKAISRTLTVAIDRTGVLTVNSANIIVPNPDGISPESLAAILNSSFASFLYVRMFGNINKIGKQHLLRLPIPAVSEAQDMWLSEQVTAVKSVIDRDRVDRFVGSELYRLTNDEIRFVRFSLGHDRWGVQDSSEAAGNLTGSRRIWSAAKLSATVDSKTTNGQRKEQTMGLSITAVSNVNDIGAKPEGAEPAGFYDTRFRADNHENFRRSTRGLTDGHVYEITGNSQRFSFLAGSCTGYNVWRRDLARFAADLPAEDYWKADADTGLPFFELVNFIDQWGVIGPEAARDLLSDFRQHQEAYTEAHSGLDLELYENMLEACEIAVVNGLVSFR